ncbi:MAG: phosphomannomutase/phosphoglucomutase [Candidatus Paceibacterota bacterium]|jgi:phosphomannomutase
MLKIDPGIFKAYDIRGIYPSELNEKIAYSIGRAYLDFIRKTEGIDEPKIAVGRDGRISSDKIFEALTQGITKQGGDVFDIGYATTPMLYWAVNFLGTNGGVMITASHNPAEYNGFKMTKSKAIPISGETGLKIIQKNAVNEKFNKGESKEAIDYKPITPYYIDFLTKKAKVCLEGKIVVDAGNAMTALVLPELLKRFNIEYIPLFFDIDCTFPNHEANPFKEETLGAIKDVMKKEKATLGVAFDGDGDRVVFLDEDQKVIRGDFVTSLLAQKVLKEKPGGKVIYDLRSLWTPREAIEKAGGKALISKVGHSLIKEQMRKEKAIFAGETSGHYFFEDFFGCESAMLAMIKVFEIMTEQKKSLKELIEPFEKYFHSGEINFEVEDKKRILKILEKTYRDGKKNKLDGLTVEFDDWWFNVRPSNTEPLLRLNLEAKNEKLLKEKTEEIKNIIEIKSD